jgi:hypothetical protein
MSRFLNIAGRVVGILCLGILSPLVASPQTPFTTKTTSSPSAYVYVQTPSGVVVYSAASNGSLTRIAGSPFRTSGLLAGSTGYAFYSVGTDYIHTYKLKSNGAIGNQISQIDTQSYPGGDCGPATSGAAGVLDHSGKYLYNFLSTFGTCSVYQTYKIEKSHALSFDSFTRIDTGNGGPNPDSTSMIQAILGNEKYAYAINSDGHLSNIIGFMREASGALQYIQINETDPPTPAGYWAPQLLAADPTNHLAALIYPGGSVPSQLASYTADSDGNLTSTNTSEPTPSLIPSDMSMSPSGLLLAVAGYPEAGAFDNGLEIFHFNGAKPITLYKVVLTGVPIDTVRWDNSNHLYAMSYNTSRIYVYTVTSTSITAAPGSPYTLTSQPLALFVKALRK